MRSFRLLQKLYKSMERAAEELGPLVFVGILAAGTFTLGLAGFLVYLLMFRVGQPPKRSPAPVVAEVSTPSEAESAPPVAEAIDWSDRLLKEAQDLAKDPQNRAFLSLKPEDFSRETVLLADNGTLADWQSLAGISRARILVYIVSKMHPEESLETRAHRILCLTVIVTVTSENEAAGDLRIEQVCRINDAVVSKEIARANWSELDL